jgi:uncharacterized protein YjdB
MKKFTKTIMAFIIISLVVNATGVLADKVDTPDVKLILGEQSGNLRYQENLKVMNLLVTDPIKLELLKRPSRSIESDDKDIISLANSLTAGLTNDYSKVKAINNWVCENIYYDQDELSVKRTLAEQADLGYQSAVTTLNTKKGVCDGYTNLTAALLRAAGIPTQNYSGMAGNSGGWGPHGWNAAYIKEQKRWIFLDTTWGTFNKYSNGKFIKGTQRQTYFDIDLKALSRTHFFTLYTPNSSDADFTFYGPENVSLSLGGKIQYNASCPEPESDTPEYLEMARRIMAAGVEIESYVSSNPQVATVDQYGRVTAHEYGTTTISAALLDGSGLTASYVVTVEPQKLSRYISFYGAFDTMLVGKSYQAKASLENNKSDIPSAFLNKEYLTWKSTNPKVVSVNKDGIITTVGIGTADLIATYKENGVSSTASTTITVKPEITGVILSNKTLTLAPKGYFTLSVKGLPSIHYPDHYGMGLMWTSSNPEIAKVEGGTITALKEGTATITVTLTRSAYKNPDAVFTDSCVVTVTKP